MSTTQLTDPWELGGLWVPNRVLLAPLAGIGNWFVRLQAKRHGAGMAVSEMISSHAIYYRNERTLRELLRIHPDERIAYASAAAASATRSDAAHPTAAAAAAAAAATATTAAAAAAAATTAAPTSIQLFGSDPEIMRSAAATAVAAGADALDLNMGCPVAKVCKTGAGVALLGDPQRAVAVARAAVAGAAEARSGDRSPSAPVTVKLRSGQRPGETSGFELAHRLVADAGVAAIAFHPRSAAVHHKGVPDYALAARLAESLPAPVILSGAMNDPRGIREAFERTGVAAVMLARGCLGNPWLFEELVRGRKRGPTPAEVVAELGWVIERAAEHLGSERAARYLRKFYPWYVSRYTAALAAARRTSDSPRPLPGEARSTGGFRS
jgi:tRNA-dihydrouridine synthase B